MRSNELKVMANEALNIANIAKDLINIARKIEDSVIVEQLCAHILELLDCSNILSRLVVETYHK